MVTVEQSLCINALPENTPTHTYTLGLKELELQRGLSDSSKTDSCAHSSRHLGGRWGVLWQVREQQEQAKHWGYVTAIMAAYLTAAAAETKLGLCLSE